MARSGPFAVLDPLRTYLISDSDIDRYCIDLITRLRSLGDKFPQRFYSLGRSGDKILDVLDRLLPESVTDNLQVVRLSYDRKNKSVVVKDGDSLGGPFDGTALLIDSAVHSGGSMIAVVDALYAAGIENLVCYSLVVKRSTAFVPNFFSILMAEHDRALFQLESLPNNRLQHKPPFGTVRSVRDSDVDLDPDFIDCGVASLNKISFADLMYGVRAQNSYAYIFEMKGKPAGFIQFGLESGLILRIDAVVCAREFQGKGIGECLIRWAETYARSSRCVAIELWAIEDRLRFYEKKMGFELLPGDPWRLGKEEKYFKMRRRILYNVHTMSSFDEA